MDPKASHTAALPDPAALPSDHGSGRPTASVVVITFNRRESLARTLEALAGQDAAAYEVIVVSDGSTDGTDDEVRARIETYPAPLRLIRQEHRGVASARNQGTAAARSPVIAFTDDDCVPRPDWLRLLLEALATDTGLAGVGGLTRIRPTGALIADYCEAYRVTTHPGMDRDKILYLPTCNAAFRHSALDEVGGFDPVQEPAGEDTALGYALRARGWRLGFQPEAVVDHYRPSYLRSFVRTHLNYGRGEMVRLRHDPLPLKLARLAWRSRQFPLWLALPFYWAREIRRPGRSARQKLLFPVLERLRQTLLVAGQWRMVRLVFFTDNKD